MDKIFFGEYSIWVIVGAIAGFLILLAILKKIFGKKEISQHLQIVRCKNCDWQGQISRYAGRCPRCNEALGDQKAKPRQ